MAAAQTSATMVVMLTGAQVAAQTSPKLTLTQLIRSSGIESDLLVVCNLGRLTERTEQVRMD
jgi:hypothetical protein